MGHDQPSIGFCPTSEFYTDAAIGLLTRLGDDTVIALTTTGFNAPMGIVVLHKTQDARSCSVVEP